MTAEENLKIWAEKSEQVSPIRIRTLSRYGLIKKFGDWGLTKGAEIGVDSGRFSEHMCKSIPDHELLCVDPWMSNRRHGSGYHAKYEQTKKRLAPYNCKIDRRIGMEAVRDVPDGSLDFVYIDGNHHFDYVMEDIIAWARKVREGGIVAGHDYYRFRQAGVVDAVDTYTKAHRINEWFLTDYLKDRTPSFFWIKRDDPWA